MSTVMNFVCVLGAILIFFLSALGAVVLYVFIKHHDEIQEKKYSGQKPAYTNYSAGYVGVNRETPNTIPYELSDIRSRIAELENKMCDVETILEVGDHGDFECDFTTTIPEDIQNLRNEVETLTRSVNDLKEKKETDHGTSEK